MQNIEIFNNQKFLIELKKHFFWRLKQTCMEFVRSLPGTRPGCTLGPREQVNQNTAYIDGSASTCSKSHWFSLFTARRHHSISPAIIQPFLPNFTLKLHEIEIQMWFKQFFMHFQSTDYHKIRRILCDRTTAVRLATVHLLNNSLLKQTLIFLETKDPTVIRLETLIKMNK